MFGREDNDGGECHGLLVRNVRSRGARRQVRRGAAAQEGRAEAKGNRGGDSRMRRRCEQRWLVAVFVTCIGHAMMPASSSGTTSVEVPTASEILRQIDADGP